METIWKFGAWEFTRAVGAHQGSGAGGASQGHRTNKHWGELRSWVDRRLLRDWCFGS